MQFLRNNISFKLSDSGSDSSPIQPGETRQIDLKTALEKYYKNYYLHLISIDETREYGVINGDPDPSISFFVVNLKIPTLPQIQLQRRRVGGMNQSDRPFDVLDPSNDNGGNDFNQIQYPLVNSKLLFQGQILNSGTHILYVPQLTTKSDKYKLEITNKPHTLPISDLIIEINYLTTIPILERVIPMSFFQNAFDSIWNDRELRYLNFKVENDKVFLKFDPEFAQLYGLEEKVIGRDLGFIDVDIPKIDFRFDILSENSLPKIHLTIEFGRAKLSLLRIPTLDISGISIVFEYTLKLLNQKLEFDVKCDFLDNLVESVEISNMINEPVDLITSRNINEEVRNYRDSIYSKIIPLPVAFKHTLYCWFLGRSDYTDVKAVFTRGDNIHIYHTDYIPIKREFTPPDSNAVRRRVDFSQLLGNRNNMLNHSDIIHNFRIGTNIERANPISRPNTGKVDHIVVLMMENRSFDQYLGYLSLENPIWNNVDGLHGSESNWYDGREYKVNHNRETSTYPGPAHESHNMNNHFRIENGKATMAGFVEDYANRLISYGWTKERISRENQLEKVMGYFNADEIPVFDYLAKNFAVCNKWFCSHPGPTLTNRFITLTGDVWRTEEGKVMEDHPKMKDFKPLVTKSIFDVLSERRVSWNYFETEYCTLRLFGKYTFDKTNILPMPNFHDMASRGELPSVSFIDPDFVELPPGNDDHPPSDIRSGQAFIQSILTSLQNSPKWNETLFIITYDENGGFYDHVAPPLTTTRLRSNEATYGARVPAFIVSPYIPKDLGRITVSNNIYDHNSIGATILRKFCSRNVPILSKSMNEAKDVWELLSLDNPRTFQNPPIMMQQARLEKTKYLFDIDDKDGFHHLALSHSFLWR
jgi:hypothetical protein